jgi:hypothetical protein
MSENGMAEAEEITAETPETTENKEAEETVAETSENNETAAAAESISYHAVEKEGSVTAIWEMQGRKHLRTIDPRSNEGKQILALFETAA